MGISLLIVPSTLLDKIVAEEEGEEGAEEEEASELSCSSRLIIFVEGGNVS